MTPIDLAQIEPLAVALQSARAAHDASQDDIAKKRAAYATASGDGVKPAKDALDASVKIAQSTGVALAQSRAKVLGYIETGK